jgi:hypothetical protein
MTQYGSDKTHHIDENKHVHMRQVVQLLPLAEHPPPTHEPTTELKGTLSFNTWHQGGLVITSEPSLSRNTDKQPMEDDEDDYKASGDNEDVHSDSD